MEYVKIKKQALGEAVVSSLSGMIISLICVLLLVAQIRDLKIKNNKLEMQLNDALYELACLQVDTIEEVIEESKAIPKMVYELSAEDRELVTKLLYCEGRGESIECQRAIVSVIINRWQSGKWGSTISDVVYAKGQFEPVSTGAVSKAKPSQTQYDVVDYILRNGITLPSWVMYFRASYHFNWKGYSQYCNIDNTYFGGYKTN